MDDLCDIGITVVDSLIKGEHNKGSGGCCMVSRKEQLVEYILVQNIPAMYIDRVEESFEENKSSFVVIDVDDNKVFAFDRETTLSIQNSKKSLGMSLAPVWDMLINTTAKEVVVQKIEWKRV